MINNRIRTIVRTAAGTALLASALGLSAVGVAGTANAAPVHPPQTTICYVDLADGSYVWWDC
jgi:hypothetical protein